MQKLISPVPDFNEGRNPDVIAAINGEIETVGRRCHASTPTMKINTPATRSAA